MNIEELNKPRSEYQRGESALVSHDSGSHGVLIINTCSSSQGRMTLSSKARYASA